MTVIKLFLSEPAPADLVPPLQKGFGDPLQAGSKDLAFLAEDRDLLFELGEEYFTGRRGIKNIARAFRYYSLAAGFGHSAAQFNLGCMYYSGIHVKKDFTMAWNWFRLAMNNGHPRAAEMLNQVEDLLFNRSLEELQPEELRRRGLLFLHAPVPDYKMALTCLGKAADKGDVQSMFQLGLMSEHGVGIDQDYENARKWYKKAGEKGYIPACILLSDQYLHGKGCPKNNPYALKWAETGAKLGDPGLMYRAGYMYENGMGCFKSLPYARDWYKKAAMAGSKEAVKRLGELYYRDGR